MKKIDIDHCVATWAATASQAQIVNLVEVSARLSGELMTALADNRRLRKVLQHINSGQWQKSIAETEKTSAMRDVARAALKTMVTNTSHKTARGNLHRLGHHTTL